MERAAPGEGIIRNLVHLGSFQLFQRRAVHKAVLTDLPHGADIQRFEGGAEGERTVTDGMATRKIHRLQRVVIIERHLADGFHLAEVDGFQFFAEAECPFVYLLAGGGQYDLLQVFALVERGVFNLLHALRDDDLADILVIVESKAVNSRHALVAGDLHNAVFVTLTGVGFQIRAEVFKLLCDAEAAGCGEHGSRHLCRDHGRAGFLGKYRAVVGVFGVNRDRDVGGAVAVPHNVREVGCVIRRKGCVQIVAFPTLQRDPCRVQ